MDRDPSHGVGRALFSALDQFAQQSGHSELASGKLILLGFSGTGALFAHFFGYAPDRVVATIPTDPHHDPAGIDNMRLPASALGVPELIMSRGVDKVCGTERPYNYFRKYRDRGAPWAFLVQNNAPHGCIINTNSLMLAWLPEIIKVRHPISAAAGRDTFAPVRQRCMMVGKSHLECMWRKRSAGWRNGSGAADPCWLVSISSSGKSMGDVHPATGASDNFVALIRHGRFASCTSVTFPPLPRISLSAYSDEDHTRARIQPTSGMDSLRLYGLVTGGVALLAAYGLLRRKPKTPDELERQRRAWLESTGRITDGTVIDVQDLAAVKNYHAATMLIYKYDVAGVTYECSQDVTYLRHWINLHSCRLGLPTSVKYDPQNPGNSLVVSENWMGLRQ